MSEFNGADRSDLETEFRTIMPNLPMHVLGKLSAFIEIKSEGGPASLAKALRRLEDNWRGEAWSLELRAVALILADLIDQGWIVRAEEMRIELQPPGLRLLGETPEQAKNRLRSALQIGRDKQLAEPGVQKFFERMHRPVLRQGRKSSIADVIDDGTELARLLAAIANAENSADALKSVIDPVVEICEEDARCKFTGLRLLEIWRYFRHTWSLEYRPIPGRQLMVLVRNAARPNHPVMGIGMLASPVVRMRVRDDWIGWNSEPYLESMRAGLVDPHVALRSLVARIEKNISEIRTDDMVSPDELALPTERTVLRLEQRSTGAAVARQRELEVAYKLAGEADEAVRSQRGRKSGAEQDWRTASEDLLFVRKRAETLAQLLNAKRTFRDLDWNVSGSNLLAQLMQHPNGVRTLNTALTEVRKAGLSSQVADVSVCGAVAPYNHLLGGKLVALAMASQEVRSAYRRRYAGQVSLISSQMAGRPIYRPAELKIITTTSLYGNGSSQYSRLKIRRDEYPELSESIEWREIAKTAGFGTVHFTGATVRTLREYSERIYGARRINHRFGEGASPRLRQIRESMDALGIESSAVLHHATPRIFYSCELHTGAREELLGLVPASTFDGEAMSVIASVWRQRWVAKRIKSLEVLSRMSANSASSQRAYFERNHENIQSEIQ